MKLPCLALCLYLAAVTNSAFADTWNLPATLGPSDITISFEVDSTWHTVHGKTTSTQGKAWLSNPKDFKSVQADISVPVLTFETANSRRDKRLREVMAADEFSNVKFKLSKATGICSPDKVVTEIPCAFKIFGDLTIRGKTKSIESKANIEKINNDFIISGSFLTDWADYGVEDPSILIAKLEPTVSITYKIILRSK